MGFKQLEKIRIVAQLKGTKFYSKLRYIWDIAENQIHPFQVGDCYQCSQHCGSRGRSCRACLTLIRAKMGRQVFNVGILRMFLILLAEFGGKGDRWKMAVSSGQKAGVSKQQAGS